MKRFFCLIIVLLAGFYLYARYLGIKGLQTHEYNIMSEDIPNEFNGFTIAQFSDFLYGGTTDIDTLSNLVDKINDYKPNVLVFTGDLIKSDYTLNEDEQNKIIEVLNKLNVEQNKFYILGDTDVDKEQIVTDVLNKSKFKLLNNTNELVFNKAISPIMIAGISSFDKVNEALYNETDAVYKIVLIHESDFADKLVDYDINTIIAGHSLGGLVKVPFIGGIIKQKNGEKYLDGSYQINDKITLYTSNGIGTDKYPYRALNTPSFNIYRLYNKAN